MDFPLNNEKFSNIYSYKFRINNPINLSVCFIPGVKSKITQDDEFIYVSMCSKLVIQPGIFDTMGIWGDKEFMSMDVDNPWLYRIYFIFHLNDNISSSRINRFNMKSYIEAIVIKIDDAQIDLRPNLTSAEIVSNSDSHFFTKITTKKYHNSTYYIIDAQNYLPTYDTEYRVIIKFSGVIDADINMGVFYGRII